MRRRPLALAAVALLLGACGRDAATTPPIVVLAAASTAPLLEAVAARYEAETGTAVRLSFASSSVLARQIEQGAPFDVFVSAHPRWTDALEAQGLVEPGERWDLLSNRLVVVVPGSRAAPIIAVRTGDEVDPGAAWPGRIAIGDPAHVPVGVYAQQSLRTLGWWDGIVGRLLPSVDARAALRLVELGEADAGIVYASDAAGSDAVTIAATLPAGSHDAIVYDVVLRPAPGGAARAFAAMLRSDETLDLIRDHGFSPPRTP